MIRPHDWSFAGGGSGGAGITTLPHLRDVIVHGPFHSTGVSNTASRKRDLLVPADVGRGGTAVRANDRLQPRDVGIPPPGRARGSRRHPEVLRSRRGQGRIRRRRPQRARSDSREPALYFQVRTAAGDRAAGHGVPRERHRPRLAAVVLPVGHAAGQGAARRGDDRTPVDARGTREAGAPDARGSAVRRARQPVRRPVAAAAGRRQGPSRSELLPELRSAARRHDEEGDRAVLHFTRA